MGWVAFYQGETIAWKSERSQKNKGGGARWMVVGWRGGLVGGGKDFGTAKKSIEGSQSIQVQRNES